MTQTSGNKRKPSSGGTSNRSAKRVKVPHKPFLSKRTWVNRVPPASSGLKSRRIQRSSTALDVITSAVARRLSANPMGRSQTVSVSAGTTIKLEIGHDKEQVTFFPITWLIPPFQPQRFPLPDERMRRSNTVFLRGCLVRFLVTYKHTFRIRMVAYSPQTQAGTHKFESAKRVVDPKSTRPPPNNTKPDPDDIPPSSFMLDWVKADHPEVVPGGPFHLERTDRQGVGSWTYDSSDGTIFGATLGKGEMRPLAQHTIVKNVNSSSGLTGGSMSHEVSWWIEINQDVHFERESENVALDGQFQILFYYDVPYVGSTLLLPTDTLVGEISAPCVKVYYK